MKRLLRVMPPLLMMLVLVACTDGNGEDTTKEWIIAFFTTILPIILIIINPIIFRNKKRLIWIYPCLLVVIEIVLAVSILQNSFYAVGESIDAWLDTACHIGSEYDQMAIPFFAYVVPLMIAASVGCIFIGKLIQKLIKNHKQKKGQNNQRNNE